jgi:hypothetical protein
MAFATIDGVQIHGTPEEIRRFKELIDKNSVKYEIKKDRYGPFLGGEFLNICSGTFKESEVKEDKNHENQHGLGEREATSAREGI